MKVKARVSCDFNIEYEDNNNDIGRTIENITMERFQDLLEKETEESIQIIYIVDIEKQ